MTIHPNHARGTTVEGEFRALQALCQESANARFWERARNLLSGYRFRDPLNQLVFDALCSLPRSTPQETREALLQRLTLKGFPDVDVEPFFHRHRMAEELVLSIIERLKFTSRLDSLEGSQQL